MHKNQQNHYLSIGVTAFMVISAAILVFFLVFHFSSVVQFFGTVNQILRPVYYGAILAFLLLPIHRWILRFLTAMTPDKQLQDPRTVSFLNALAIIFSMLVAVFIVYILLAMVLPQLYQSIVGLINAIPGYFLTLQTWFLNFTEDNPDIKTAILPYYNSIVQSVEDWLQSSLLPNLESINSTLAWLQAEVFPKLSNVFTSVSTGVVALLMLIKDLFIAIIIAVYLLVRKDVFSAQAKKIVYGLFQPRWASLMVGEVRNAYRILSAFINGKLLDSLLIGLIALVCCNLFQFPFPALLATIIGVTNIIPFFGPFIGAVPCALLILLINPLQCFYFVIFILVLQQFDGNILGPKILGDSTGLASFWVLFSILLFGGLFGFAGMVLGVPVFATFYSIISRYLSYRLARKGLPTATSEYMGIDAPDMMQTEQSHKP